MTQVGTTPADRAGVTRWVDLWLDESQRGDWQLPAARLARFRLVGGAIVGTADALRFVPNPLEARFGARALVIPRASIVTATMGRRRLRLGTADGAQISFFVNRRGLALNLLGTLLGPDDRPLPAY